MKLSWRCQRKPSLRCRHPPPIIAWDWRDQRCRIRFEGHDRSKPPKGGHFPAIPAVSPWQTASARCIIKAMMSTEKSEMTISCAACKVNCQIIGAPWTRCNSSDGAVPICGLHQKPLIKQSLPPADQNPQGLGHLVLVCPVTQETVRMKAEDL